MATLKTNAKMFSTFKEQYINNYRTAWEYFSKRKSSVQTKRTWQVIQPWRAFRTGFPEQAYLELGFEGWVGVLQEKEYSRQKEWQQHVCTFSVFPAGLCSLGPSAQSSAHGRCSAHISWTCRKNCTLKRNRKQCGWLPPRDGKDWNHLTPQIESRWRAAAEAREVRQPKQSWLKKKNWVGL